MVLSRVAPTGEKRDDKKLSLSYPGANVVGWIVNDLDLAFPPGSSCTLANLLPVST